MKSEPTSHHMDLSELSTEQLTQLLWTLKGTPPAQPLYRELARRSTQPPLYPDDPDWEAKFAARLLGQREY